MREAVTPNLDNILWKLSVVFPFLVGMFDGRVYHPLRILPQGVLNYLPGPGGSVGDVLVDHPQTRFIAFTGSKEVGIRINQRAAAVQPGQKWLKRTILEMGGKDAILVDETADLDEAAAGIVSAAFGYQGQKCSACSRAIIVDAVYDELLQNARAWCPPRWENARCR